MDIISRYYIRKQNLAVQDEYHERLALEDINELQKASVYMMLVPVFSFAVMYGYGRYREEGGASSSFKFIIDRAKQRIQSQQKWPAGKDLPEANLKTDFSKQSSSQDLKNAYD